MTRIFHYHLSKPYLVPVEREYYNAYYKSHIYDLGSPLSLVLAILGTSRKRVL